MTKPRSTIRRTSPSPAAAISPRWRSIPETGVVEVVNFIAVDDVGRVINPMIVEGQVQGGVAQGIGQALLETAVYDAGGQLLSGSFMDYTMPRADNMPNISVATENTMCTHNPLGSKGCGEVGAIGSPPAVINAIVDALRDYGVRHMNMPATARKSGRSSSRPSREWRRNKRSRQRERDDVRFRISEARQPGRCGEAAVRRTWTPRRWPAGRPTFPC